MRLEKRLNAQAHGSLHSDLPHRPLHGSTTSTTPTTTTAGRIPRWWPAPAKRMLRTMNRGRSALRPRSALQPNVSSGRLYFRYFTRSSYTLLLPPCNLNLHLSLQAKNQIRTWETEMAQEWEVIRSFDEAGRIATQICLQVAMRMRVWWWWTRGLRRDMYICGVNCLTLRS